MLLPAESSVHARQAIAEVARLVRERPEMGPFYQRVLDFLPVPRGSLGSTAWLTQGEELQAIARSSNSPPGGVFLPFSGDTHAQMFRQVLASGEAQLFDSPPPSGYQVVTDNAAPRVAILPVMKDSQPIVLLEVFLPSDVSSSAQQQFWDVSLAICELAADYHQANLSAGFQGTDSRLVKEIHKSLGLEETCYALANEARPVIGCDRVTVLTRKGTRYKVRAISGQEIVNPRANLVQSLQQLVQVVTIVGQPFWHPEADVQRPPQIEEELEAYLDLSLAKRIGILPLWKHAAHPAEDGEEPTPQQTRTLPIGALVLEDFKGQRPMIDAERSLAQEVADQGGIALGNALEYHQLFLLPVWQTLSRWRDVLLGSGRRQSLAVVGGLVAAILFLSIARMDFYVTSDGTLRPSQRQNIFAPWDGVIDELYVRHAEKVTDGQILLTLRSDALDLESRRLDGEIETQRSRLLAARSRRLTAERSESPADRQLAAAEEEATKRVLESLTLQRELQQQLQRQLQVASPFAGQVLTWNPEELLHKRPVQRGQLLLEVADLDGPWCLRLTLPDRRIGHVLRALDQAPDGTLPVTFILASDPRPTYTGTVREVGQATRVDHVDGAYVEVLVDIDATQVPFRQPETKVQAKILLWAPRDRLCLAARCDRLLANPGPLSPMVSAHGIHAVEDRVVTLRRRPDLQIHQGQFQGEFSWIVKDPISLHYHRLQEPEMIVLEMLDGQSTLRQIREQLHQRYPTKTVRLADLHYLLAEMHRAGLVVSDAPGQGQQLLLRKHEQNRKQWLGALSNVLAIRFPGFDPEPILQWLHPRTRWLFEPRCVLVWTCLAVSALLLVLSQWDEFRARLPDFYEFFSLSNFLFMALVLAVTKVGHEFGHGLSCKHFGGECHEIGVMLLVLTPALYCDTSDSWTLRNKWHRAFIGGAGMYVEVWFASLATWVWWYTQPGLIHYLALNVMFICSVSTIVFNANPLLRYDGYYILSDILEIPNLAQKSRLALLNALRVHALGMQPVSPRQLPQRGWLRFAAFSVASVTYRWFILFMILLFLRRVFKPYGLEVVGQTMIVAALVGLVGVPLWKSIEFFLVPGRLQQVKRKRFVTSLAISMVVLAIIVGLPLPRHVRCAVVVRPEDGRRLYVSEPGRLVDLATQYGDTVEAGTEIARLESPPLQLELIQLEGEAAERLTHLHNLQRRLATDPALQAQLPAAQAAAESAEQRLSRRQEDAQRLILRAPVAGIVIPPREVPALETPGMVQLPNWTGYPLVPENRNAVLAVDTHVATMASPGRMKAVLIVNQTDIEAIAVGQPVNLLLDEYPHRRLAGSVTAISNDAVGELPPELTAASGGDLSTTGQPHAGDQPMFVCYEATVPLHDPPMPLISGMRGRAKIRVAPESLATRVVRLVRNLLHFR